MFLPVFEVLINIFHLFVVFRILFKLLKGLFQHFICLFSVQEFIKFLFELPELPDFRGQKVFFVEKAFYEV